MSDGYHRVVDVRAGGGGSATAAASSPSQADDHRFTITG
jgi:hypothetical protein